MTRSFAMLVVFAVSVITGEWVSFGGGGRRRVLRALVKCTRIRCVRVFLCVSTVLKIVQRGTQVVDDAAVSLGKQATDFLWQ